MTPAISWVLEDNGTLKLSYNGTVVYVRHNCWSHKQALMMIDSDIDELEEPIPTLWRQIFGY